LGRQLTELLAPIRCLQFHGLGNVRRSSQAFRETEAVINIAPSNVDRLTVERKGALTSRDDKSLPTLQYSFERVHIKLARLSYALLGESAHRLWHLRIASELIELSCGLAICSSRVLGDSFARFLSDSFGSCLAICTVRLYGANFASGLAMCAARLLGSYVS
jgi:hypothetical protein